MKTSYHQYVRVPKCITGSDVTDQYVNKELAGIFADPGQITSFSATRIRPILSTGQRKHVGGFYTRHEDDNACIYRIRGLTVNILLFPTVTWKRRNFYILVYRRLA
ncbi:hypothetical protein PoB_003131900 [Plakobranchus ocellatus]|uniref:Uncharacterized protein n=1 Tax=Plakobranchus ocellatus TaxID=259542 RepID=A0AAV4AEY8_9GAST|nr:hypothetical protein PoB_003131900 [Plakobranchus ocellatus]